MQAPRLRKWPRRLLIAAGVSAGLALALWMAIHRVRWLGPMLADGARAILGPSAIARVEEIAYGAEDEINLVARRGEAPVAYWEVTTAASAAPPVPALSGEPAPFRPTDVGPIIPEYAAPGDGAWMPIADAQRPEAPALMYKTLLHPDARRPWSAVAIVAVDLASVDLRFVMGRREPESTNKEAQAYERKAIIPEDDQRILLGAFNGGFKAIHGHWGVKTDGITFLPPRAEGCTVAMFRDGSMTIRTYSAIEAREGEMLWYRQTPRCLVEEGALNPGLRQEATTLWGAAVGGNTVIRRSAIGLSKDGKVLYVGIGDAARAPVIAAGMRHAGAFAAAQLDVNWSFPRFLLFEPREKGSKELVARALCKGFEFTEDEYVREKSPRDFFYLVRSQGGVSRPHAPRE